MKPQANRLYLTTGEVAAWLRVSPRTVQWLIRTRQLVAALRIADEYFIEESGLAAFIDAHTVIAPDHQRRRRAHEL